MERHGADLEAEARKNEDDAEDQADVELTAEHLRDAREIGGAGEAVQQRDAIEQHARRKRAEDEIFEAGFARPFIGAHEASEHIGGKAVELEPDIERHQVARRGHDAHAERREQDKRWIFGAHPAVEKARRDDDADEARGIDQKLGKTAEAVDRQRAREDRRIDTEQRDDRCRGGGERQQRAELIEADIAVTEEGAEHQGDEPADRQDQFGPDEHQVGGHWTPPAWLDPWAGSPCGFAAFGLPAARCASPAGLAGARRATTVVTSPRIGARKLSG